MNNTFVCVCCTSAKNNSDLFLWTKCNHKYCKMCATNVINFFLSILNCIPKCKYPECDQLLDITHGNAINSLLLSKYRINDNPKRFIHTQYLLCGYIRHHTRKLKHKIIPNEVNLLILDYYNLIYVTKKSCFSCMAIGYKFKQCNRCAGNGFYSINCHKCHPTHPGIYKYTIDCYQCKGNGKKLVFQAQCNKCNGEGEFCNQCKKCSGSGIYKDQETCRKCSGSGSWSKRRPCRNCSGTGNCSRCEGQNSFTGRYGETITRCNKCSATGKCRNCDGDGFWVSRGKCYACDGDGWHAELECNRCEGTGKKMLLINCFKCNSSGVFKQFTKCRGCNGRKIFHKQKKCVECKTTGYVDVNCVNCAGDGKVPYNCSVCASKKYFIMLDFNKLCNKQLLCNKCNEYCPKDRIVYWSSCYHVICVKCIFPFIEQEITSKRIPICPFSNCRQALEDVMVFSMYCEYNLQHVQLKLNVLIDRKDKFKCVDCSYWHGNSFGLRCANDNRHQIGCTCAAYWSKCNHIFCYQCMIPYISNKIHSDIIPICLVKNCKQELVEEDMNQFTARYRQISHLKTKLKILIGRKGKSQCSICHRWDFDASLVLWSQCYHQYHQKCGQKHIENTLPSKKSVFNFLKKESIPVCCQENCDQMLNIADSTSFGVTNYQYKLLCSLIEKSKKSDDCIVM
eukprot:1827_1